MTGTGSPASETARALAPSGASSSPARPNGLVLSPLRALRYDTAVAGPLPTLTSPPYDVIDAAELSALERASAHNVVRLILPRETPGDTQATSRYARAAATLVAWRTEGALVPDPEPALYVYEMAGPDGHVQRGLLGALALSPPQDGIVLPHEDTMAGPVSDRLALYTAVDADLEPIFLVYDGGGAASRLVAEVGTESGDAAASPAPLLVDEVLGDGLRHRLWAVTDEQVLADVAADLHGRKALIADGHHRYATYLRRQSGAHEAGRGSGPWDFGLCLLVDATAFGPQVHPIHRFVPGRQPAELARMAEAAMRVRRLDGTLAEALQQLAAARGAPAFLLAGGGGEALHLLTEPDAEAAREALPAGRSPAWGALDVSVLHTLLVARLWGVPDDVEHLGFAHDVEEALAAAARTSGTAVLMNSTPVEAVAAVAASGERMPRKSTLFTPKPRTGVVIRDHRDY